LLLQKKPVIIPKQRPTFRTRNSAGKGPFLSNKVADRGNNSMENLIKKKLFLIKRKWDY
jgi:hypothetical protein